MLKVSADWLVVIVMIGFSVVGCGGPAGSTAAKHDDHGHAHDHPSQGPHAGELIELGKEEYHAELIHDDATHTITIYVLDGAAKAGVPIEATELALNLLVEGKPQQFKLPAKPATGDPAGKSSCFALTDQALCTALDTPKTTGRLNLTIAGKSYVGKISAHDHNHP
ncbi:MAG: hypothetical protein JNM18_19225 [Planctomycetaceae bacterium]|nr:hypothetical protein [Planctomycetaceae bacterium]